MATCYVRPNFTLFQQWKNRQVICLLSTAYRGHTHNMVTQNTRVNNEHAQQQVSQPKCISDYNKKVGGIGSLDQRLGVYRVLRHTRKYWKTIFVSLFDIAVVNTMTFLVFEMWWLEHSGVIAWPNDFPHSDFQANMIHQLAGIDMKEQPPKCQHRPPQLHHQPPAAHFHLLGHGEKKRNCVCC